MTPATTPRPVDFRPEYGHLIGGEWVAGQSGELIPLSNPATGEVLSHVQSGTDGDVTRAVDAAAAAYPAWSQTPPSVRQALLTEISRRLRADREDYAWLETLNNGKPIRESRHADVPIAIEQFDLFAGASARIKGEVVDREGTLGLVHRESLGVVAQIIPWNGSLMMMAAKIAPALAAGNTIVLKPSEVVSLAVMEFFRRMGDIIPAGVVNVVTGFGPNVGEALVTDPRVRLIAFTGSQPTARKLMEYAQVNIIPQLMELGGKSANIVCADADIAAAAEAAAICMVRNKGELCLAGNRLLVHNSVVDEFTATLLRLLDRVVIGDPASENTQLGAQASQAQVDKIMGYIAIGKAEGATLLRGGHRAVVEGFENGLFIEPTLFTDVDNSMRMVREEIFGPVATIQTWTDEDEVLALANDSRYGLAGGLWTNDLSRAHRMSRKIETGTVWINRYYGFPGNMPTGGYKGSGFGREWSDEVLNHYTQTKSVVIDLTPGALGMFGA